MEQIRMLRSVLMFFEEVMGIKVNPRVSCASGIGGSCGESSDDVGCKVGLLPMDLFGPSNGSSL